MRKIKNSSVNKDRDKSEIQSLLIQNKFSDAVSVLFEKQQQEWSLLKEGLDALSKAKTNKFFFNGYEIQTQFNLGRINSTIADVSTEAIKNRKCFLCTENLPEGQEGILYKDKYSILLNPYPIFKKHLTISSVSHIPQRIKSSFLDLLKLSKDLPGFTFIYNGPECGASAPDHLHFQAFPQNSLPVYNDYEGLKNEYGEKLTRNDVAIFGLDDGIRKFLIIESSASTQTNKIFRKIYGLYSNISKSHVEPMLNVISSYDKETGWRVIIFFRKKHRPDAYFNEGDSNILVSPASIDLGGVLITPLEKDFKKINKEIIAQIYKEVSVGKEAFEYLKTKLKE